MNPMTKPQTQFLVFQQKFSWTPGTSVKWLCSYYMKAWGTKIHVWAARDQNPDNARYSTP